MGISRPHVWWHEICKFRPWNAQKCLRPCALKLCQSQFCRDDNAALISAVTLIRNSVWFFDVGYIVYRWFICQSHPSFFQRYQPRSAKHFRLIGRFGLVMSGGAIAFQNSPQTHQPPSLTIHQPKIHPKQQEVTGVTGVLPYSGIFWPSAFSTWQMRSRSIPCGVIFRDVPGFLHPPALSMWSTYSERIFSTSPSQ